MRSPKLRRLGQCVQGHCATRLGEGRGSSHNACTTWHFVRADRFRTFKSRGKTEHQLLRHDPPVVLEHEQPGVDTEGGCGRRRVSTTPSSSARNVTTNIRQASVVCLPAEGAASISRDITSLIWLDVARLGVRVPVTALKFSQRAIR